MVDIPAPDAIFGNQGITREDAAYAGSHFREVRDALFANPYQKVWGGPGEPALPVYRVTTRSAWAGSLPFGRPPQFRLASIRTLDSAVDLRWGEDGRGFRRLVRPHGVCVTGVWEIAADNPYSGYFRNGSRGLVIARISAGLSMALRGLRRSYGMALKLYPTVDESHEDLLRPANVFLADDLGGTPASRLTGVSLTNAPNVTGWNRGNEIPVLLKEGMVFELVDRKASMRQVYPIAELGKPPGEPTRAPQFLRLQASPGQPTVEEDDIRNEVLGHLFDKGNPAPQRQLYFDISVSDFGKRSGFGLFQRQAVMNWQTIGQLTLSNGVASYNGDFVIHFRHPAWRKDRNDPGTAVREGGRKVRWF